MAQEREKLLDPAFLLVLALMLAAAFLSINEIAYQGARHAAQQTFAYQDRRADINRLVQALFNAQTHLRGYMLSSQPEHLDLYQQSRQHLRDELGAVSTRLSASDADRATFGKLQEEVIYQMSEMDLSLRLFQQDKPEALQFLLSADRASEPLQSIQAISDNIVQEQGQEMRLGRQTLLRSLLISRIGVAFLSAAALLAFWLYLRQVKARKRIDAQIQQRLMDERDALEKQVRQRTASLSELASYLQQVRENERAHLARELHDELGALLTAAKLDIARLRPRIDMGNAEIKERIAHLSDTLNQVISLKRRIIEDLHPSTLSTLGLNAALEILTQRFTNTTGVGVESNHEVVSIHNADLRLTIYRVIQESLNNIAKYAKASSVQTFLHQYPSHLFVRIRDDGIGFDPDKVGIHSHGLRGMRHRIEAMGGQLRIDTAPGKGCTITATLPMVADLPGASSHPLPPPPVAPIPPSAPEAAS
ncbi:ATP-binding protein [Corticibacter populi]|nr:ATP-binding protein [Corticibacter populi]RZS35984.1 signal transduction histidine kinase [Corticibacter populi]